MNLTPEMAVAGDAELANWLVGIEDRRCMAVAVFIAMLTARTTPTPEPVQVRAAAAYAERQNAAR